MKRAHVAAVVLLAGARVAPAQSVESGVQQEIRADAVAIGNRLAVQAGGGVQIPFGIYTRVGIIGAAGADIARFEQDASGRLDLIARFLFDPLRQSRWGVSAGGGVSVRARARDRVRPYLAAVVDVEGPRTARGYSPAIQFGIGGGVRLGAALRWGPPGAR